MVICDDRYRSIESYFQKSFPQARESCRIAQQQDIVMLGSRQFSVDVVSCDPCMRGQSPHQIRSMWIRSRDPVGQLHKATNDNTRSSPSLQVTACGCLAGSKPVGLHYVHFLTLALALRELHAGVFILVSFDAGKP
jgi:hypothetical protein